MEFQAPKRFVQTVFLHCSASDVKAHDDVSVIRRWHLAQGWKNVGYHFFIKSNGEVQTGRSLEDIPAAQYQFNTGTIAICMHGLTKFTKEQELSLKELCSNIQKAYSKPIRFRGHKEVDPHRECPVYNYKKILNLDDKGFMKDVKPLGK